MPDGQELGAELFELWKAGEILLPQAAVPYAQATRDLHNAGWRPAAVFDRPAASWLTSLRNLLTDTMASTAESLVATGTALVAVSQAYAAQDAEAAVQLTALQAERAANPDGLATQGPDVPEPRHPGDPFEIQVVTDANGETHEEPVR